MAMPISSIFVGAIMQLVVMLIRVAVLGWYVLREMDFLNALKILHIQHLHLLVSIQMLTGDVFVIRIVAIPLRYVGHGKYVFLLITVP